MTNKFWECSSFAHLETDKHGRLKITDDYLRAFFTRPELAPDDSSCAAEIALNKELVKDPYLNISNDRIAGLRDGDTADNYRVFLAYRDDLVKAQTIESAYLVMMRSSEVRHPSLFINELVQLILRNCLRDCDDPLMVRAAELFFRPQKLTQEDGGILLADEQVVGLFEAGLNAGQLGRMLKQVNAPLKKVSLDVLGIENGETYWPRSNEFDMVIDFRSGEAAIRAYAKVIEAWMGHLMGLDVTITPHQSISDEHWRWHIGLDVQSNDILNAIYQEQELPAARLEKLVALFQLDIVDHSLVKNHMQGKPVYLGLAVDDDNIIRMKPQNLLTNLPLRETN